MALAAQATSYENFKLLGLIPQTLPTRADARAYADFFQDGQISLFTATLTYSPGRPIGEATASLFAFWKKTADGSYAQDSSLLGSNAGCIHPRKAIVADFNGDGKPDVFVACHGYDAVPFPGERSKVVLSQSNGTYIIRDAAPDVGFFHSAASADLNNDGKPDIVVAHARSPRTAIVWLNQGDGSFVMESTNRMPASIGGKSYYSIELVDVDGDSKIDVVLGGHEAEGADSVVLINPGSNDFSAVTPTVLPSVANEAV